MVSIRVDKQPAYINVSIFLLLISFFGFKSSRDAVIHITIEMIGTIVRTSVDIIISHIIYILRFCCFVSKRGNAFMYDYLLRFAVNRTYAPIPA